jgi:Leucine-rich repeat (LRR) protein
MGKIVRDRYFERIAKIFPSIEKLKIGVDDSLYEGGKGSAWWVGQRPFSLPPLPNLKVLDVQGNSVEKVFSREQELFGKYKSLESLQVDLNLEFTGPAAFNLPGRLKNLTLGSKKCVNREYLRYIVETCPELQSLTVKDLSREQDTFGIAPLQGMHLKTLSIVSEAIEFPDIFTAFPNLKSLSVELDIEVIDPGAIILYPSNSLEELAIKSRAIDPEIIPTIFLNYPNLKSLHLAYDLTFGLLEVAVPPTHANLQLHIAHL